VAPDRGSEASGGRVRIESPRRQRSRAIVTGGAGFIGSHLVDRLVAEGLEVLVIDDLSTGRAGNVPDDVELQQRDIAAGSFDALFRRWRPDVVFHLAAQSSVSRSVQDPARDLAVNVLGTHHVTSAARISGSRLVFVSSGGAIYGETRRAATELTPPAPLSYYGVHKLAAERHVSLAASECAILRPSNVYGPRQVGGLDGAVVAAFIEQARGSQVLEIHGSGAQSRDFIHVTDIVEALWQLSRPAGPTGTWNVSAGRSISVSGLAEMIERAVGHPLGRHYASRRSGDVNRSAISSARLRRLGWKPTIGLARGVRELLELA
jgi:UDP-glucose 4-epimerase